MNGTDAASLLALPRLLPAIVEATGEPAWADATAELITGGKSNLTFFLTSDAGQLVVRRPPTGDLLPSAHDMGREAKVQRGLAATPVPVPRIVLYDSGELIGIQCYVMEKIPGHIIRGQMPAGYAETPAERTAMGHAFIDTLAALHEVDYEAVGLADYGRPAGFMERQVRRWTGQWEASKDREVPDIDRLAQLLAERIPPQRRNSIAHGDFRTDNVVYDLDDPGQINGVLDWELSALGDPLSDLGLVLLFWRQAGERQFDLIPGVSHLPGFPTRDQLLARYAEVSGADISDMGFYLAFAHFKFAVIAQGVFARSKAGAMGGQDFGDLADGIAHLGHQGLQLIKEQ